MEAPSCSALQQRYSSRMAEVQRQLRQAPCADKDAPVSLDNHFLLLECIANFLDAEDIVCALATSRSWASILSSDDVWADQCIRLWEDKIYVPAEFRDPSMTRMSAYFASLADGARVEMTSEELCSFTLSLIHI